eukprot:UN28222
MYISYFMANIENKDAVTMLDVLKQQVWFSIIGLCDAINGMMVVYAAPGNRTSPELQSILGNFLIPMTVFFRWIILSDLPSLGQLMASVFVVIALFVCLVPKIFDLKQPPNARTPSGTWGIMWPIIFACGFFPAALMNVVEEKVMKDKKSDVNLLYMLFSICTWQLFWITCFFGWIVCRSTGFKNTHMIHMKQF